MSIWSDLGVQEWRRRATPMEPTSEASSVTKSDVPDNVVSTEYREGEARKETPTVPGVGVVDPIESPPLQVAERQAEKPETIEPFKAPQLTWKQLVDAVQNPNTCSNCAPVSAVLGDGDIAARWVFVIDSPSQQDIQAQQLLSGRAGQLFDAILAAVQLSRSKVYLTSVFKCPPNADFKISSQCGHLVHQQMELIQPEVIVCLGEFPAQALMRANEDLPALRQLELRYSSSKVPLIASYSIADLLETPSLKKSLWSDLKAAMALLRSKN